MPSCLDGLAMESRHGFGAQEKTRTSTTLWPLAPEASASTNSATWATGVGEHPARCGRDSSHKVGDVNHTSSTKYIVIDQRQRGPLSDVER